jgi:uncharacterized membrane protein SpoIIM required for sporulation
MIIMLEYILDPGKAARSPILVAIVAIIFSLTAVFLSLTLFYEFSSVLMCAFITMFFTPFFLKLFAAEEAKELTSKVDRNLLRRHVDVIKIYSAFFIGVIFILSLLFVVLPNNIQEVLFSKQVSEIKRITSLATGNIISFDLAKIIFLNNTFVLLTTFLLSFIFGAGAVLILSWNASVIAVYAGNYINSLIAKGTQPALALMIGLPQSLLSIALHGIPEIIGYFFAGLAGGILSATVASTKLSFEQFRRLLADSLIFLSIGEFSIFIGAFIESANNIFTIIAATSYLLFLTFFVFSYKE